MPRNVRNFWIELDVDGRKTKISTGPVRKDGGFRLKIFQRNLGRVMEVVNISGVADGEALVIDGTENGSQIRIETRR